MRKVKPLPPPPPIKPKPKPNINIVSDQQGVGDDLKSSPQVLRRGGAVEGGKVNEKNLKIDLEYKNKRTSKSYESIFDHISNKNNDLDDDNEEEEEEEEEKLKDESLFVLNENNKLSNVIKSRDKGPKQRKLPTHGANSNSNVTLNTNEVEEIKEENDIEESFTF